MVFTDGTPDETKNRLSLIDMQRRTHQGAESAELGGAPAGAGVLALRRARPSRGPIQEKTGRPQAITKPTTVATTEATGNVTSGEK